MQKLKNFLKSKPLITGIVGFLISVLSILLFSFSPSSYWFEFLLRLDLSIMLIVFMYLIRKSDPFAYEKGTCKFAFKKSLPFLILNLVLGIGVLLSSILGFVKGEIPLVAHPVNDLISIIFFTMLVGFVEEFTFRAVLADGIICQFRNKKGVFVIAAIVSCFLFGLVHVISDINMENLTNVYALIQIITKIVSSGMFALILLLLYWKTKNIVAVALIHSINDLVITVPSACFDTSSISVLGNYVIADQGIIPAIPEFATTIIYIVILLAMRKSVTKQIDFESMRENW